MLLFSRRLVKQQPVKTQLLLTAVANRSKLHRLDDVVVDSQPIAFHNVRFCSLEEVSMTTGIIFVRGSVLICFSTSNPSTLGNFKSSRTTFEVHLPNCGPACAPRLNRKSSASAPSRAMWIWFANLAFFQRADRHLQVPRIVFHQQNFDCLMFVHVFVAPSDLRAK